MSEARDAGAVCESLREAGVSLFAGVPCSITEPLRVAATRDARYVACTVEGEAIALLAGAWLGGARGVALLQSSGLGHAVNPLATLCQPYRIPVGLVVSWRGEPGTEDAVHHHDMGRALPGVLAALELGGARLREEPDLTPSARTCFEDRRARAWVVGRGDLTGEPAFAETRAPARAPASAARAFEGGAAPTRDAVVDALAARFPDDACVSTTGYLSRALARHALPGAFYMQGSMGFALAVGAGVTLAQPARAVTVLDGDGALLMGLGGLALAGSLAPRGLRHVVVDNGRYASTGGQPAPGPVDFAAVALACGYARAARCASADALADALAWLADGDGPALLHVRVEGDERSPGSRPEETPPEIAARVRAHVVGASP